MDLEAFHVYPLAEFFMHNLSDYTLGCVCLTDVELDDVVIVIHSRLLQ